MSSAASEFKLLCEKLAKVLEKEKLKVLPYSDPSIPHFIELSEYKQKVAVDTLRDYVDICEQVQNDGTILRDTVRFCSKVLRRWGMVPTSNILDHIKPEDSVEIYTPQNLQIFRNLRFFELCSYSVEEIYTLEWWKLYQREEKYTQLLFSQALEMIQGNVPGAFQFQVPGHELSEMSSTEKRRFWVEPALGCPVVRAGEVAGFLFTTAARRLS